MSRGLPVHRGEPACRGLPVRPEFNDDSGSALVEFLAVALLLLIPVIYLILTLTELHAGKYAATSAVHSAARAFVTADDVETAYQHATAATRIALDDQGFHDIAVSESLTIECAATGCFAPESHVHVVIEIPIRVPGIPFLGTGPRVLTAHAEQVAAVESFRGGP